MNDPEIIIGRGYVYFVIYIDDKLTEADFHQHLGIVTDKFETTRWPHIFPARAGL